MMKWNNLYKFAEIARVSKSMGKGCVRLEIRDGLLFDFGLLRFRWSKWTVLRLAICNLNGYGMGNRTIGMIDNRF
jgi:hypothetical protein